MYFILCICYLFIFIFREIQQDLAEEVKKLRDEYPGFQPGMAIVQVGDRQDSNVYIRMKLKSASDIGINASHVKLPRTITQFEVQYFCYMLRYEKFLFYLS